MVLWYFLLNTNILGINILGISFKPYHYKHIRLVIYDFIYTLVCVHKNMFLCLVLLTQYLYYIHKTHLFT